MSNIFKIGTRSSPLALVQANMLKHALKNAHPDLQIEIIPIKSHADWKKSQGEIPLNADLGGKGLFATEIESALSKGDVDCGVHSLKDMASFLPDGLVIKHVLPRADVRDAFISAQHKSLNDLPQGATLGTCSVRRAAFALHQRPDLNVVPFRGNVGTRLDKITAGQVDATFLAMAGITRLKIDNAFIHPIEVDDMLPACGQGVICMETRANDTHIHTLLEGVHCPQTGLEITAEREVLRTLDGSCHTPIAVFAKIKQKSDTAEKRGRDIFIRAMVASLDGQEVYQKSSIVACSTLQEARDIGQKIGEDLKANAPHGTL